tara:strand:- start:30 stop:185 length:156 start_codon:yes stop_codon:yes gene_type:complete
MFLKLRLKLINRDILEAENALKNISSISKKEICFWNKQIKTNQEKQKFFSL